MNSLTAQQSRRRLTILRTVRTHLSKRGYEGLSMRDVAADAGVSPTTLYNIFDNKDNLVLAALQDTLAEIGERVSEGNTEGIDTFLMRIRIVAEQIVATPEYAKAMTQMMFNADAIDPIALILLRDQMTAQESQLEEMQDLGQVREDIERSAWSRILVTSGWSCVLLWLKGYLDLGDFQDEYERAHLAALQPIMTGICPHRSDNLAL